MNALGIERACDGNNHDADGTIEITDIGCAHSEWYDFNTIYVDHPGWGIDSVNKIVATFTDIDLAKWSMYYDLWGDGECLARHVLAKDNKSGEIVLFRIENGRDYYYRRSAYYVGKNHSSFEMPKKHLYRGSRMSIKMVAKKTDHNNKSKGENTERRQRPVLMSPNGLIRSAGAYCKISSLGELLTARFLENFPQSHTLL